MQIQIASNHSPCQWKQDCKPRKCASMKLLHSKTQKMMLAYKNSHRIERPEADSATVVDVQRIEHQLLHLLGLPAEEVQKAVLVSCRVHYYPIWPKSFSEYSLRYVSLLTSPLGLTSLKLLYHSWGDCNFSSLNSPLKVNTSPTYLNLGPVHN